METAVSSVVRGIILQGKTATPGSMDVFLLTAFTMRARGWQNHLQANSYTELRFHLLLLPGQLISVRSPAGNRFRK